MRCMYATVIALRCGAGWAGWRRGCRGNSLISIVAGWNLDLDLRLAVIPRSSSTRSSGCVDGDLCTVPYPCCPYRPCYIVHTVQAVVCTACTAECVLARWLARSLSQKCHAIRAVTTGSASARD